MDDKSVKISMIISNQNKLTFFFKNIFIYKFTNKHISIKLQHRHMTLQVA